MERLRTIAHASATLPDILDLQWSDGQRIAVSLSHVLKDKTLAKLADPSYFLKAATGEWGHSVDWPGGEALGADCLWRLSLLALGRSDTVSFLDWRMRHGLTLADAAAALGISRRMVAYYCSGEKTVPLTVLLACKGWEQSAQKASG